MESHCASLQSGAANEDWFNGGERAKACLADDNERRRAGSTNIGARSLDMYNNVISK
jgi:hypothetical protein